MPDETTTRPAMPPEEWAAQLKRTPEDRRRVLLHAKDEADADGWLTIHGLAALALYGQPFGFTREDVEDERETATVYDFIVATTTMPPARAHAMQQQAERHRARAAKIAALLPEPGH